MHWVYLVGYLHSAVSDDFAGKKRVFSPVSHAISIDFKRMTTTFSNFEVRKKLGDTTPNAKKKKKKKKNLQKNKNRIKQLTNMI